MVINNQLWDWPGNKESWERCLRGRIAYQLDVGCKGEERIVGNSQVSGLTKCRQGRYRGFGWVGKC